MMETGTDKEKAAGQSPAKITTENQCLRRGPLK